MASVFELTPNQTDVFVEVLSSLSLCNAGGASGPGPAPGTEPIYVHELSMFLLAQLFSREAQRPDAMEHWPEGQGQSGSLSLSGNTMESALLSPTRQGLLKQQSSGACMGMGKGKGMCCMRAHGARHGHGTHAMRMGAHAAPCTRSHACTHTRTCAAALPAHTLHTMPHPSRSSLSQAHTCTPPPTPPPDSPPPPCARQAPARSCASSCSSTCATRTLRCVGTATTCAAT